MRGRASLRGIVSAMSLLAALALAVQPVSAASSGEGRGARRRTSVPTASRSLPRSAANAVREAGGVAIRASDRLGARTVSEPLAPVAGFSFEAIPRTGGNWPADPTGAVSDTWYFTAVNTHYALYDLAGAAVLGPTSFAGLFDLPGGSQVFDPKVAYDPYGDTFVLTFLAVNDARGASWILVVTIPDATADDRSTWCRTKIEGDRTSGDGRQWADYPGLGYTTDRVTISTNQFDFATGRFTSAQVLSIPKMDLYACDRDLRFDTFVGAQTREPDGSRAFTLMPAISVGAEPSAQYLVSLDEGRRANLVVWRLKPSTDGTRLSSTTIPIGSVTIAPYGTQCNGSLRRSDTWWDPGDLRFVTAFLDADTGHLYTAHVVRKDLDPDPVTGRYAEAVVRWYDVRPDRRLAQTELVRRGMIGEPETDVGWPALATDAAGTIIVTYSQASAPNDECLSAYAAQISPGQTDASSVLLTPGEARFEAKRGPERWGDFAAAVRDPVDGTRVVLVDQFAAADGGQATEDWQQMVHVVTAG